MGKEAFSAGKRGANPIAEAAEGDREKPPAGGEKGTCWLRSQGMAKARSETARQGRYFSARQRGISAPSVNPIERSARVISTGKKTQEQHCMASHTHRNQALSLHRRKLSSATIRGVGQRPQG